MMTRSQMIEEAVRRSAPKAWLANNFCALDHRKNLTAIQFYAAFDHHFRAIEREQCNQRREA